MKLATFTHSGRTGVGVVDDAAGLVRPVQAASMLALIEAVSAGGALPAPDGVAIPLADVALLAPVMPRRNIFCVGKNYRAHAKEFARSGFEAGAVKGAEIDEYPAVFTKPASTVVGQRATSAFIRRLTCAVDYEAELAVVIGKGGATSRASGLRPCVRLHDRQRRDRARPPAQPQAVVPRQVARHVLPDGPVDHDRR